jgi:hypothetical protein
VDVGPTVILGTCSGCGAPGFVGAGSLATRRSRLVCPECERRRVRHELRNSVAVLAAVMVLDLAVGGAVAGRRLVGWLAVMAVTVVVHEAGHALTAWALGFDVRVIRLGLPVVARCQIGRTRIELGPIPLGGHIVPTTRQSRAYRARRVLVVLAGPLANVALAVVVWRAPGIVPAVVGARAVLVVQALLVVMNLWPRRAITADGATATDGALLVELLRLRDGQLSAALANEVLADAVCDRLHGVGTDPQPTDPPPIDPPPTGAGPHLAGDDRGDAEYDGEPLVALRLAQTAYLAGDMSRAAELYGRALADGGLEPRERAMAANDLAWTIAAELRDPLRLARADELSAEAFELLGWHPAIRNTRGAVLVLTGRPSDGVALLAATVDAIPTATSKARCLAILTEGHLALGDLFAARRSLQRALDVDGALPGVVAAREAFVAAAAAADVPVGLTATTRSRTLARR